MERISRFRAGMLLVLFLAVLGFYCFKLYDLQVIQTEGSTDNETYYTVRYIVRAARGDILDCNGNVLVSNRASYDLVFIKEVITSSATPNETLLQLVKLCREMGIEYIDHFPVTETRPFQYTLDEYSNAWQSNFQTFLTTRGNLDSDISAPLLMEKLRASYEIPEDWSDEDARLVIGVRYELSLRGNVKSLNNYIFVEDVSEEALAAILELNVPGLTTEASTVREYQTDLAAHILGYCGAMDSDQWEYYKTLKDEDDNSLYTMDAQVGQSGLEKAFEEYLHGVDGIREDKVTKDGTVVESTYLIEPKAGNNVQISIDLNLQRAAEEALQEKIEALRATGETDPDADGADVTGGAVVVMDVSTGQVLACASYPTYNLETFREDYDSLKDDPYAPMFNRALQGVYPPGSTFKVCMSIAGLESGTITPYTQIEDLGVFTKYDGFDPKCLIYSNSGRTHGSIDVMTALEKSCNYFYYELADRMWYNGTSEYIENTAKAMGLGESTGIELAERTGRRANAETKAALYTGSDAIWYQGDQILSAIGQSENLFSPLQLCVYASTLANQGIRYRATFLNRVVSADYSSLVEESKPETLSILEISDTTYSTYLAGMKRVATAGSAKSTFSNYPISIACKTGTADTDKAGASPNAAFICFAPADDPQIAISVYGEQAGYGSSMAGIAKSVLDIYFDVGEVGEVTSNENQVS